MPSAMAVILFELVVCVAIEIWFVQEFKNKIFFEAIFDKVVVRITHNTKRIMSEKSVAPEGQKPLFATNPLQASTAVKQSDPIDMDIVANSHRSIVDQGAFAR